MLELSIEESALDMTAAATAPRPIIATTFGVKYCRTRGTMNLASSVWLLASNIAPYAVLFQSASNGMCMCQIQASYRDKDF